MKSKLDTAIWHFRLPGLDTPSYSLLLLFHTCVSEKPPDATTILSHVPVVASPRPSFLALLYTSGTTTAPRLASPSHAGVYLKFLERDGGNCEAKKECLSEDFGISQIMLMLTGQNKFIVSVCVLLWFCGKRVKGGNVFAWEKKWEKFCLVTLKKITFVRCFRIMFLLLHFLFHFLKELYKSIRN